MKRLFTLLFVMITGLGFAQLPENDFPDFTFSDLDGNTHHLQSYLDQGKTVFIDVFATWCPNCTASIPTVRNIYETYGQAGDNSIVVLYMERDANTSNEASYVATHNIDIPVITGAESFIAGLGITYQPVHIIICPDGTYDTHLGSIGNGQVLLDLIDQCGTATSIDEASNKAEVRFYSDRGQVFAFVEADVPTELTLFNLVGRKVAETLLAPGQSKWNQNGLEAGIYILRVGDESYKIVVP